MNISNIRELNTNKIQLKNYQRALKIDDKVFVIGIGGDSVPINNLNNVIKVGYATITDEGEVFFNELIEEEQIIIPTSGLIFYDSLNENKEISDSGHTLITEGNISFTENCNIKCCKFNSSRSYLYTT